MAKMRRTKTELVERVAELEEQLEEIHDAISDVLGIESPGEEEEETEDEGD